MLMNLDNALGIHAQALKIRAQRQDVLANNIANADTPNFKARDVDFAAAMQQAQSRQAAGHLALNNPGHMQSQLPGIDNSLKYRTPLMPSMDGNTVDTQVETAKYTENAIRYEASLNFINSKVKGLLTAIRGE